MDVTWHSLASVVLVTAPGVGGFLDGWPYPFDSVSVCTTRRFRVISGRGPFMAALLKWDLAILTKDVALKCEVNFNISWVVYVWFVLTRSKGEKQRQQRLFLLKLIRIWTSAFSFLPSFLGDHATFWPAAGWLSRHRPTLLSSRLLSVPVVCCTTNTWTNERNCGRGGARPLASPDFLRPNSLSNQPLKDQRQG